MPALKEHVLHKGFYPNKDEDQTADQLRLLVEQSAKSLPDIDRNKTQYERRCSNDTGGEYNADRERGKADADGEGVDARGNRLHQQQLEGEPAVNRTAVVVRGQRLINHLSTDKAE